MRRWRMRAIVPHVQHRVAVVPADLLDRAVGQLAQAQRRQRIRTTAG